MAPIVGFRITNQRDAVKAVHSAAETVFSVPTMTPSKTADYIYRIAAVTAGLALLASVV